MFRRVCSVILDMQPQLVGSKDFPAQIDESFFVGKRSYNKRRLLVGKERNLSYLLSWTAAIKAFLVTRMKCKMITEETSARGGGLK